MSVKGDLTTAYNNAQNSGFGLGWNPWKGPSAPLGPYNPTVGAGDTTYRAPGSGDSPWLAMRKSTISDNAAKGAAGAGANAWSQLASMGGVRSGTAQNIASTAANNGAMNAQAGISQASIADEANNQTNQKFDITNRIGDAKGRNDYDLGKYNTEMQGWAAKQQSDAIRQSGKK